ncbi:SNARE associated Golgi protein family, partial [Prunus dulcis]
MLFLRLTSTLPNTFINLASPIVDAPYHIFFLATIIGLIPTGYVTVKMRKRQFWRVARLAFGELRKENNFLRSLWPVTNPHSSQEHLLHPQLLQKPLRPFLGR